MENRQSDRIPVHLKGHLDWEDTVVSITVLNISTGGACLAIDSEHWNRIEDYQDLCGVIHFNNQSVPFRGEVRWSSTNDTQTLAGIAFHSNQHRLIAKTLELLIQEPLEKGTAFRL